MPSEALAVLPPSPERVAEYFRTRRGTLSELSAGDLEFNDRLWRKICGLSDGEPDIAAQDARLFGAGGAPGVSVAVRPTDVLAPNPRVTYQPAAGDESESRVQSAGARFSPGGHKRSTAPARVGRRRIGSAQLARSRPVREREMEHSRLLRAREVG